MRRFVVAVVTATALIPAASQARAAADPIAQASCTRAKIAGESKCIARGQYCSRSSQAMRDYRKYGLSCTKRDSNGRYHLQ
ncbi:hypothetical protein C8N24_1631 [Solirubrobacter pauli]|uniref:Uncharacterized protein n=1 Tax=Solirubrobacter pauli TaxID=166793 RepID=A0A660LD45_9ACTN|nr:hypothetical protein [Solirubrobacter pauli]RKQ91800.1 hypothetical protein C8N24_1631 [Solirubrobacter pauli]